MFRNIEPCEECEELNNTVLQMAEVITSLRAGRNDCEDTNTALMVKNNELTKKRDELQVNSDRWDNLVINNFEPTYLELMQKLEEITKVAPRILATFEELQKMEHKDEDAVVVDVLKELIGE